MITPAAAQQARIFYGWRIVAVAFLVDFVAVGFFFYSYGVFFKALAADFGGSRLGVSLGLTVTNVVGAVLAPFLGRALDRLPIKRVMIAGACSTAAGFLLASQIGALWHYYLVLGTLTAVGMLMMGGIVAATLVSNWFVGRLGTALGIATMGISLSGVLMPPTATWLIEHVGWRGGFQVYALGTLLVVVPVVALVVVNRPEDLGLRPDGVRIDPARPPPPEPVERTYATRELLGSAEFWVIAVAFAFGWCCLGAVLTHMVPHFTDLGIDPYRAASILSVTAGAGVVGKLAYGWLFDRVGPRAAIGASFASQLAGVVILLYGATYPVLVAGGLVFGFGMGGVVPLQGATIGFTFGRLSYGKVTGLLRPVQLPIAALGNPLAGWIYDVTGSYTLAFQIFAGMYSVATVAVLAIGSRRERRP